jgi:hypothetical protein
MLHARGVRTFCLLFLFTLASLAEAQDSGDGHTATTDSTTQPFDGRPLLDVDASEWMVAGGPAFGVVLFNSAEGHRYLLQTVSWGRVLSGPLLGGPFRGRFEWALEAAPVYSQYAPSDTYGFGFTPIVWRWNFDAGGRIAPYAELAGGALWTRDPVPAGTTTANFSAHAAFGARIFLTRRQALVASYRLHHISNGNRLERNPGVNAHVVLLGFTYVRPHR